MNEPTITTTGCDPVANVPTVATTACEPTANIPTVATAACGPTAELPTVTTSACDPDENSPTVTTASCGPPANLPTVTDEPCQFFYSEQVTGVANCPEGQSGSESTVTLPVGSYESFVSQAEANALAQAAADAQALAALVCLWLNDTEQSYTAICDGGLYGDDVTVVVGVGEATGETVEAANAAALAQAQDEAEAALVCYVYPEEFLVPNITGITPVSLGAKAGGVYRIRYVDGCLKYNSAGQWTVNLTSAAGFRVYTGSVFTPIDSRPNYEAPSNGYNAFATPEEAVTHHGAAASFEFTHGSGGIIVMKIVDSPFNDNIAPIAEYPETDIQTPRFGIRRLS